MILEMWQYDLDSDVVTNSSLIGSFTKAFQPEEASEMIRELPHYGFDFDVVPNSSLIDAIMKATGVRTRSPTSSDC